MDGGFFLCPDAWEFLLPAEICHLRNAGAVCRKRWDLLTLTPMGCALLPEPAAVTAGILLLPGDCPRSDLRAGTVVTYVFSLLKTGMMTDASYSKSCSSKFG